MCSAATELTTTEVMPETRYLAVVYQFGKVASTSLVATMNQIDNVEALQSHFMGEEALTESLTSLLSPDTPEYFFSHQLGQFERNVRLTRRFRAAQSGASDERLLIISLARDPLEWFRSSVVQDIEGHLPRFRNTLDNLHIAHDGDGEVVQLALTRLMSIFSRIFEINGGVDNVISKMRQDSKSVFKGTPIENDIQSHLFFYMMIRPFTWFTKHFEKTLGVNLADMQMVDGVLTHSDASGDYFVFRYEELEASFRKCLANLGIEDVPEIAKRNISNTKRLSEDVKSAFRSPSATRLNGHFLATDYAHRFGYSETG